MLLLHYHLTEYSFDSNNIFDVILVVLLAAIKAGQRMIILLAKTVHADIFDSHSPVVFKGACNGWQLDAWHHNDNKHVSSIS